MLETRDELKAMTSCTEISALDIDIPYIKHTFSARRFSPRRSSPATFY